MLERYLTELRQQTANTSARLTHLLQNRDALQQDAETYNGLIAELVGEGAENKDWQGAGPEQTGKWDDLTVRLWRNEAHSFFQSSCATRTSRLPCAYLLRVGNVLGVFWRCVMLSVHA